MDPKKLFAGITLFAFSIILGVCQISKPFAAIPPPASHTRILVITPQSTKDHLDSVATAWRKDSIDLVFSRLKFDSDGKLIKIKGWVNFKAKGQEGSGTFESDNLQSIEIKVCPGVVIKTK